MKLIWIKWFDSYYDDNRLTTEEVLAENPYIIEDVGFLIGESKLSIHFATSWSEKNNKWKYIHCIPKCNILKKRIINLK